ESKKIDVAHLNAALTVWRYSERSCLFIFGEHYGDKHVDFIMQGLRESENGKTRTEISEYLGRHTSHAEIARALRVIEKLGAGYCETEKTSGRPIERWRATQ